MTKLRVERLVFLTACCWMISSCQTVKLDSTAFIPEAIPYEAERSDSYLRCYDPDRNIVFSHEPNGLSSCGGSAYRISEADFKKF